ncbi:UNKNOWN [Stylonychia lemnae]|uniref:Uncharacterized protein n=1 Tax=Stylonychia lemnae TaxID=5949 RepID=A0A078A7Y6_STYLE|nr:UNKNOWN [Stylonychia lemnae]|eukprot:CDW76871.1 UNKNOWN [Stylonychia lemnae]
MECLQLTQNQNIKEQIPDYQNQEQIFHRKERIITDTITDLSKFELAQSEKFLGCQDNYGISENQAQGIALKRSKLQACLNETEAFALTTEQKRLKRLKSKMQFIESEQKRTQDSKLKLAEKIKKGTFDQIKIEDSKLDIGISKCMISQDMIKGYLEELQISDVNIFFSAQFDDQTPFISEQVKLLKDLQILQWNQIFSMNIKKGAEVLIIKLYINTQIHGNIQIDEFQVQISKFLTKLMDQKLSKLTYETQNQTQIILMLKWRYDDTKQKYLELQKRLQKIQVVQRNYKQKLEEAENSSQLQNIKRDHSQETLYSINLDQQQSQLLNDTQNSKFLTGLIRPLSQIESAPKIKKKVLARKSQSRSRVDSKLDQTILSNSKISQQNYDDLISSRISPFKFALGKSIQNSPDNTVRARNQQQISLNSSGIEVNTQEQQQIQLMDQRHQALQNKKSQPKISGFTINLKNLKEKTKQVMEQLKQSSPRGPIKVFEKKPKESQNDMQSYLDQDISRISSDQFPMEVSSDKKNDSNFQISQSQINESRSEYRDTSPGDTVNQSQISLNSQDPSKKFALKKQRNQSGVGASSSIDSILRQHNNTITVAKTTIPQNILPNNISFVQDSANIQKHFTFNSDQKLDHQDSIGKNIDSSKQRVQDYNDDEFFYQKQENLDSISEFELKSSIAQSDCSPISIPQLDKSMPSKISSTTDQSSFNQANPIMMSPDKLNMFYLMRGSPNLFNLSLMKNAQSQKEVQNDVNSSPYFNNNGKDINQKQSSKNQNQNITSHHNIPRKTAHQQNANKIVEKVQVADSKQSSRSISSFFKGFF